MNKVLVKRSDGSVAIVIPTKECTQELLQRDVLSVDGYVSHRDLSDQDIPVDRRWRNAWSDENEGSQIDINIEKCRKIHLNRLRKYRNKELENVDVEARINSKDSVKLEELNEKAQSLRDMPDELDLTVTNDPNLLYKVIPSVLEKYREHIENDFSAPM